MDPLSTDNGVRQLSRVICVKEYLPETISDGKPPGFRELPLPILDRPFETAKSNFVKARTTGTKRSSVQFDIKAFLSALTS